MLLTLIPAAITAFELWSAWKTLKKPVSSPMLVIDAIFTIAIITLVGIAMPWYRAVDFGWWYAFVAASSLHIGAIAWRLGSLHSKKPTNKKPTKSPKSPLRAESLPNLRQDRLH